MQFKGHIVHFCMMLNISGELFEASTHTCTHTHQRAAVWSVWKISSDSLITTSACRHIWCRTCCAPHCRGLYTISGFGLESVREVRQWMHGNECAICACRLFFTPLFSLLNRCGWAQCICSLAPPTASSSRIPLTAPLSSPFPLNLSPLASACHPCIPSLGLSPSASAIILVFCLLPSTPFCSQSCLSVVTRSHLLNFSS